MNPRKQMDLRAGHIAKEYAYEAVVKSQRCPDEAKL